MPRNLDNRSDAYIRQWICAWMSAICSYRFARVVFMDILPIAQILNIKFLKVTIARYYEKDILSMNTTLDVVIAIDAAYPLLKITSLSPFEKCSACTILRYFSTHFNDNIRRFSSTLHVDMATRLVWRKQLQVTIARQYSEWKRDWDAIEERLLSLRNNHEIRVITWKRKRTMRHINYMYFK